jgi:Uma2 family endonuclease
MSTVAAPPETDTRTLADLIEQLGGIPPERIRANPPPGAATEEDVLRSEGHAGLMCELIDGVLVEKAVGYYESLLAMVLGRRLGDFVEEHDLGIVLGEGGTLRVLPSQVRIPDLCVICWARFPNRCLPPEPIPAVAPDLAVEVLSKGNTPGEMRRKLRDYFQAGVRLVWYVDPKARTVEVYTSPQQCAVVDESGVLDGGDVLPGFRLSLRDLFARAERGRIQGNRDVEA